MNESLEVEREYYYSHMHPKLFKEFKKGYMCALKDIINVAGDSTPDNEFSQIMRFIAETQAQYMCDN